MVVVHLQQLTMEGSSPTKGFKKSEPKKVLGVVDKSLTLLLQHEADIQKPNQYVKLPTADKNGNVDWNKANVGKLVNERDSAR